MRAFTQWLKRDLDLVVCVLALITHDTAAIDAVGHNQLHGATVSRLSVSVMDVTAPAHEL